MKGLIAAAAVLVSTVAPASASTLIGETLKFERLYPNLTTQQEPFEIREVVSGSADSIQWGRVFGNVYGTMNAESGTIEYVANRVTSFIGSGSTFDGFRVTGFSNPVTFASIASNTTGLSLQLFYDTTTITLDVSGSQVAGGSFTINVTAVPEPGSVALFSLGFAAIALRNRTRNRCST